MKVIGDRGLGSILKKFLQICLGIGIIILIFLPFVLQKLSFNLIPSIFIIYPNGILLLIIAYKFIKLFDSLRNNNPFCYENVKILKSTQAISLISSLFWLLDLIYEVFIAKSENIIFIVTLGFLCILFLGVSIALYILSELIKEATEYKQENELTI